MPLISLWGYSNVKNSKQDIFILANGNSYSISFLTSHFLFSMFFNVRKLLYLALILPLLNPLRQRPPTFWVLGTGCIERDFSVHPMIGTSLVCPVQFLAWCGPVLVHSLGVLGSPALRLVYSKTLGFCGIRLLYSACSFVCFYSYEPENQPKRSSETATTIGPPKSSRRSPGRWHFQSTATDKTAAAADGKRKVATEASRTASAGEATG